MKQFKRWCVFLPSMLLLFVILLLWSPFLLLNNTMVAVISTVEDILNEFRKWIKQWCINPNTLKIIDNIEKLNQYERTKIINNLES